MVFFNHATRQMTTKIVYYGPGLCGKTTNLSTIYSMTSQKARGEMVSLNTETDRTLFFDLLPMEVGVVSGFKTRLQLYTVPGQVFYNSTRKLVLTGVDGIVFVVDSQEAMLEASWESYQNLKENLLELGLNLADIPMVFQWNKRDLASALSLEVLESRFNPDGLPSFQSVASEGAGVFETLRGITRLSLARIKAHLMDELHRTDTQGTGASEFDEARPLTLEDLPDDLDLFELDPPLVGHSEEVLPLPDEDDDAGFCIEAPASLEPPAIADAAIAAAEEGEGSPGEVPGQGENSAALSLELQPGDQPGRTAYQDELMAVLDALKLEARRASAQPRAIDHTEAITSFLGELTQVARAGSALRLRLDVPSELEDPELELVVQLRSGGQVLAEGQFLRPAPSRGGTARLSVELKRG